MGHGERVPDAIAGTDPKPFGDSVRVEDERPVREHALFRAPCCPRCPHDRERVLGRGANAAAVRRLGRRTRLAAGPDRDRDRADQRRCKEVLDELGAVRHPDLEPGAVTDPLRAEPLGPLESLWRVGLGRSTGCRRTRALRRRCSDRRHREADLHRTRSRVAVEQSHRCLGESSTPAVGSHGAVREGFRTSGDDRAPDCCT